MTTARCWICGDIASSKEHRLKKADIVRAYGRGPYRGDSAPVHVRGGKQSPVQGPDSNTLKYKSSLCHKCNTATTQPFDQAYDIFISWLFENESAVLYRRYVDFADAYGPEFPVKQCDLYKYFAKSFGCRLVDAGYTVPADVIELLSLTNFRTGLRIPWSVNEDILLLPKDIKDVFIGKGDLYAMAQRNNPHHITGYIWNEHVSWFTVNYWYDYLPEPGLGSTWVADTQCIYLGNHSPLSQEMRIEFMERLNVITQSAKI